ncbi:MAG: nickel pincer cofactor biosynthesis protein LarC [Acidimicrobiales bacterium]|nr:nickel pincer cofactor biosynthesis protein LarC [Acidimicrobiales bacterium]
MSEPVTIAWFHCFSGIAGDMALGSLIDAGADVAEVRALCERLPLSGWAIDVEPVLRSGIGASRVHVRAQETSVVRTASHITGLVQEARLPERVTRRALAVFDVLARAEGRLHRRSPEQVHFHEVGGIDSIVDVVGTCAALEVLGVDDVQSSPVANGIGMVRTAHGLLPNPAPAVVELLHGAPTYSLDVAIELTTPTGAALLAALACGFGPLPPMVVASSGFGAGTADLGDRPNLTQVVIGTRVTELERGQPVVQLEVNVDDATGEALAHAVGALLDAGAHDAWITPIVMKKGRPAHTVSVLADVALTEQLASVLTTETGSLGVRAVTLERWPRPRSVHTVDVDGYPVRVKVSPGRAKVEAADAARVARRSGRPLREVLVQAEARAFDDLGRATGIAGVPSPADTELGDEHDDYDDDPADDAG